MPPKDGWDKLQVIATVVLSIAGVTIAFVIGKGQLDIARVQGQTSRTQALASLVVALGDEKPTVRRLSAISLAEFGTSAVDPLLNVLSDEEPSVQAVAFKTLVLLHEKKVPITARVLQELPREEAIGALIRLLVRIEKQRWHDYLLQALQKTPVIANRVITALITEVEDKDFQKFTLALLAVPFPELRKAVAETLGNIGGKEALEPLRRTLKDKDRGVLRAGAYALTKVSWATGSSGRQKVVQWISEAVRNTDLPVEDRLDLLDTLQKMDWKEIRLVVKDVLQDEKVDMRTRATRIVGQQWDGEAAEWLMPALKDREWRVRIAAIEAFGHLCEKKPPAINPTIGPQVQDTLPRMVEEDQDHDVRKKAKEINHKIQELEC